MDAKNLCPLGEGVALSCVGEVQVAEVLHCGFGDGAAQGVELLLAFFVCDELVDAVLHGDFLVLKG